MTRDVEHIAGHTFHARHGAVENAFRYRVDYLCVDPEDEARGGSLFSRNRWNLAALHDIDHGGAPGHGRGAAWVREILAAHHLDVPGQILLVAQPRV
ncbi:MAG: DUF1365 family protein, partial [Pseudomonadota bacterium]